MGRPKVKWPNWLNLLFAGDDSRHKNAGSEQLNSIFPGRVKGILPGLSDANAKDRNTHVISVPRPNGIQKGPINHRPRIHVTAAGVG